MPAKQSKQGKKSLSVCISTIDRAPLLSQTLNALAKQKLLPDEIIISDASKNTKTEEVVEKSRGLFPKKTKILLLKSKRRALPFQRWNAFCSSTGEIVLFLDDDVLLSENALKQLIAAYSKLEQRGEKVAGIGFPATDQIPMKKNFYYNLEEALFSILVGPRELPPGTITPGGRHIALKKTKKPMPSEWLWGGSMSYKREVIAKIGLLERLVEAHEKGYGASEDLIFSNQALAYGKLFVIPVKAIHMKYGHHFLSVQPKTGWERGLWATYGIAHSLRWAAKDKKAVPREWLGLAAMEIFRSVSGIARRPLSAKPWARLAGAVFGSTKAVLEWKKIPASPK